ncbi:MEDS domain-containing protein [Rossellomorea sp. y25]|uniref:MEDS domain-containing protein n=1 Tax=Rossellomorea sp. y25 TaxID=3118174 RepID=UPI002605D522|nr:MEDS domain-containing protein [uncultured Rossellomorea sp.]
MEALNDVKLVTLEKGHVFYQFQAEEAYLNNLMLFIRSGLEKNQHMLIIESMRNINKVRNRINRIFSKEQQSSIYLVDNFDYYFLNGDFNTQNILNHFKKDIAAIKNLNTSIRTWAHVEWTSAEPDAAVLKKFESIADDYVLQEGLLSVCAYSKNVLSGSLINTLEQVHMYVMTDDSLELSMVYGK